MTTLRAMTPWSLSIAPMLDAALDQSIAALPVAAAGVDIAESVDSYHVKLALPGIDPGSLRLELAGNVLTVHGEFAEKTRPAWRWLPFGREHASTTGTIEERLTLPGEADAERAEAQYRDGILSIRLPKVAPAGRRIPVRAGKAAAPRSTEKRRRWRLSLPVVVRRLLRRPASKRA